MAKRKNKAKGAEKGGKIGSEAGSPPPSGPINQPFKAALSGLSQAMKGGSEQAQKGADKKAEGVAVRRDLTPKSQRPKAAHAGKLNKQTASQREAAEKAAKASREAQAKGTRPEWGYEDRVAFSQAYTGVVPLGGAPSKGTRKGPKNAPKPIAVPPPPQISAADVEARARLAELVAGGLKFEVYREADGFSEGFRVGQKNALKLLREGDAVVDGEIDLHGCRVEDALGRLGRFLRQKKQDGARIVRIVHGKGLHSDGGRGVLQDAVLEAITEKHCAPFVRAFCSASYDKGGTGALVVLIER